MNKKTLKVIAGTPDKPIIIQDIEIPCYVLEDETRVLSQRGVTAGIGLNPEVGFRMPQLMASKAISPFVNNELVPALKTPILFKNPTGGGNAYGYPATILVDICLALLEAQRSGKLRPNQEQIGERCAILLRGFSHIGIIALVDEATGYQQVREKRALATILEKFIADELQPWTKTFPYEFYKQIARLKGWSTPTSTKRPSVLGHYTNDFVYERLPYGVLEELRRRNPSDLKGYRKSKHHQWFNPEIGYPKLKEHLSAVIALMKAAPNWDSFKRSLTRALPKQEEQMLLKLEEED